MNITSTLKSLVFDRRVDAIDRAYGATETLQRAQLDWLLRHGRATRWGEAHGLDGVACYEDFAAAVPAAQPYESYRPWVMRMVEGERDVLWPGVTRRFAQSSGTSDGKSKYIPVTDASLRYNHYRGGSDVVARYLSLYPDSRIFSGKAFILGGSFANELDLRRGVKVGDLSAHLIECINPLANLVRIPRRSIALMEDWRQKLPALVEASLHADVTNISGVPSWFMTVIKEVIARAGATTIHDVWPRLEVFFHGGIAFGPYREQYARITDASRMRYLETYNASEGFFAIQDSREPGAMLLLVDGGVFYEFIPVGATAGDAGAIVPSWLVEPGEVYEMVITSCNGLWRYALGDTVRIETVEPLRISIAGRTKHFINAFGEELMVDNADRAIAAVEHSTGCEVLNYTAAPVYAGDHSRGRHQWLIEFAREPECGIDRLASLLDSELQSLNSDYQAKRAGGIFLDPLQIVVARRGLFDDWLATTGKLGGQRKIPRLCNTRRFIDPMLAMNTPES